MIGELFPTNDLDIFWVRTTETHIQHTIFSPSSNKVYNTLYDT